MQQLSTPKQRVQKLWQDITAIYGNYKPREGSSEAVVKNLWMSEFGKYDYDDLAEAFKHYMRNLSTSPKWPEIGNIHFSLKANDAQPKHVVEQENQKWELTIDQQELKEFYLQRVVRLIPNEHKGVYLFHDTVKDIHLELVNEGLWQNGIAQREFAKRVDAYADAELEKQSMNVKRVCEQYCEKMEMEGKSLSDVIGKIGIQVGA